MPYPKTDFRREKHPDHWLHRFEDLLIKTDPYTLQDPGRVLVLGWGCGTQMNYMARHPEIVRGKKVFEPFAGSGPMGFLALKLGAAHVDLLDINPRAITFQRDNARLNGFPESAYTLYEGDIASFQSEEQYDAIFANPPFIPIPSGVPGALHSAGGCDGNRLIVALLARMGELLRPDGEAMLYAFQIENEHGPLMLQAIDQTIRSRPVELTRAYAAPAQFDDFATAYLEAFPAHEADILAWSEQLHDTYGSSLGLNDYIVHIGPKTQGPTQVRRRDYDGTKYAEGYFDSSRPISAKSRVLENKII